MTGPVGTRAFRAALACAAMAAALSLLLVPAPGAHSQPGPNQFYLPDPATTVHVLELVEIPAGSGLDAVRIWGTLENRASSVSVIVEGPRGAPAHTVAYSAGVAGDRYEAYHPVSGDGRHLEGEYAVTVSADYSGIVRNATATFYLDVLWYDPPDVRIHLGDHAISYKCQYSGCPPEYGGPYAVPRGGSVEWENGGRVPHHMYSVAEGYGAQRPGIPREPGPNAFDGGIIPPGEYARVQLESPGSVIFTCRFHPWMEGLILVESPVPGEPDGGDIRDPPSSVLDILGTGGSGSVPAIPAPPGILESEGAALEEEARRLEAERLAAEIAALERIAEGGAPLGAAPEVVSVSILESPVGLWGGVISATVRGHDPDALAVYLEGPDGAEVLRTRPGGPDVTIPVQPTWPPGPYVLRADDGHSGGSSPVTILESPESCIGDTVRDGRLLCLAGTVTGATGSYIYIDRMPVRPAGAPGILPQDICREGAAAVADFDPGLGRDVASVWCDGVRVNPGPEWPGACESERPPARCAIPPDGPAAGAGPAAPDAPPDAPPEGPRDSPPEPPAQKAAPPDAGAPEPGTRDARPPPGGDCPVALISYGTALAEPVQALREYRDDLEYSGHGPLLDGVHAAYYSASPHVADVLRAHGILADAARTFLAAPLALLAWVAGW